METARINTYGERRRAGKLPGGEAAIPPRSARQISFTA